MSWRASLSKNMDALRFLFNPSSKESIGLLKYLKNNFNELKILNPKLPLLIRGYNWNYNIIFADFGNYFF